MLYTSYIDTIHLVCRYDPLPLDLGDPRHDPRPRSASMTAPNGPSQQECVRGSMREAGLTANQITCSELHGDSVFSVTRCNAG
jgi:hypothetical protein